MEEDLVGVGWKKKNQKIPNFHLPHPPKKRESNRMKDFLNFILAFVPNFTQKTKKLGCIVS
jgi:hypothetical protein